MLTKEHVWPYLRILRAAIVAAVIVLSYHGVSLHFTAWPSHITVVWLGLGLIAAGLLLYFALTSSWPRRVLAVFLLLLALFPFLNRIGVQSPWWLQIHTVTHVSENLTDITNTGSMYRQRLKSRPNTGPLSFPVSGSSIAQGDLEPRLLSLPSHHPFSITNTFTTNHFSSIKISVM
ncbi:MAG: hypothetical protein KatS3mg045_0947 [Bellilinea sp.]|nr:MAG: hypothetical protein KatS3mg045_0947 [Bellilinea sp.]